MSEPTRTALRYDLAAANVQLESLNMECRRLDIYMGLTTLTKVTRFTDDDEMLKKYRTYKHMPMLYTNDYGNSERLKSKQCMNYGES